MVADVMLPVGIYGSTPTAALHERRDVVQLLFLMVVRRLLELWCRPCWLHLCFSLHAKVPKRRVFFGSVAIVLAGPSPSGAIPANGVGGRRFELVFVDGGDRRACVFLILRRVCFVKFEDIVLFSFYLEVFLVKCNPIAFS
jgi:hypothetical protein